MLVLTRKVGQEIRIGEDIVLKVTGLQGGRVRIGIDAPIERRITREEQHDGGDHAQRGRGHAQVSRSEAELAAGSH